MTIATLRANRAAFNSWDAPSAIDPLQVPPGIFHRGSTPVERRPGF
ncbi:hypothetical protein AB5I41_11230 [Sphingomonas sp. MMS24-JH45]